MLQHFIHSPAAELLGWTLLHSLWQLALIALLAAIALASLRRASASARYLLGVAAMLGMLAAPIATALSLHHATPHEIVQASTIITNDIRTVSPQTPPTEITPLDSPKPAPTFWQSVAALLRPCLPAAVTLYILGTLLLSLRLLAGLLRIAHLRRHAIAAPSALTAALARLQTRLHLARPVPLLLSTRVEVPTVIGIFRPLILVPAVALTGLPPDLLAALLAHELAHIRRHDPIINMCQSIAETLLFYHPAVWWLSAKIRQEREHCCDDRAISITPNRALYAHALAQMESLRPAPAGAFPATFALQANGGSLLPRIRRILLLPPPRRAPRLLSISSALLSLTILLSLLYILGCSKTNETPAATNPTTAAATRIDTIVQIPAGGTLLDNQSQPATAPAGSPILCKATLMLIPDSDLALPENSPAAHPPGPQIIAGPAATILLTPADIPFKNAQTLSRPYLLLNNGQTGDIEIGQSVDLPTDYKKADPAGAWTPVTTPFFSGISLKLTATLAADQKNVAMDLSLRITSLPTINYQHAPNVPLDQDLQIALPTAQSNTMQTKITAPLGDSTVILGPLYTGSEQLFNTPTQPAATAAAPTPPRRIVLVLTATLPKPGEKFSPATTLP